MLLKRPHTVSRKRRTGVNGDGTPSYGAQDTVSARVEKRTTVMRNAQGKEVTVAYQMAIQTFALYDDLYWFPSILGEPADDTSSLDAARRPAAISTATNLPGTQGWSLVGFV